MDIADKIKKRKLASYLTTRERVIYAGAVYHITQRAPGRELVFLEDGDFLYCLKLLKDTVKKFELELFAFALLPNHLHLLIKINDTNLSQAMKNLFERYAIYFNSKYKRKGHVFCGRYRASLCNENNYFLAASIYIHNNPYKLGLCKDSRDYRWSSIKLYTAAVKKSFMNFRDVLSILDSNINTARKQYGELIDQSMNMHSSKVRQETSHIKATVTGIVGILKHKANKKDISRSLDEMIAVFASKKRISSIKDENARRYLIEQLLANGYTRSGIMQELDISRITLYRIMNKSL